MRPRILRSLAPFVLAAGVLVSGSAGAQGGDQSAIAEDLFRQAKALMEQSKFKEACEKFEGSQRLDPSTGTLLNLADCNQKLGKLASAWAQFGEAATLAKRAGTPDRATVAAERAKALEPRLSRVKIIVGEKTRVPGLELRRDEIVLDSAVWNGVIATDTGKHIFKATAPGKTAWSGQVDVQGEGKVTEITVPPLVDAPVEAKPEVKPIAPAETEKPVAPPPPPAAPTYQRTAGFVVGGVGVAGLAVGGIFGGLASSEWSSAKDKCPGNVCPDQSSQDSAKGAKTKATVSTVAFIGGGVLVAVGVTLVLISPDAPAAGAALASPRRPKLAVTPQLGSGAGGFDLVGSFLGMSHSSAAPVRSLSRAVIALPVLFGGVALGFLSSCAQVLGIEDTKLDNGGPDVCSEEMVPYIWTFVNNIKEDGVYPLSVIPATSFAALRGAFGQQPDETKGHIVADARDCREGAGVRDGGPGDAGNVRFEFKIGSLVVPSNFFISNEGLAERNLTETQDVVSLGGFLNAPAEQGTLTALPLDLDGAPSATKSVLVRPGYLTTLRMEPSAGISTPAVDPIPARWSCVGNVPSPTAGAKGTFRITAKVTDFSTGTLAIPAPGIRFRVCNSTDLGCDLSDSEKPDTTSGPDGVAEIDVPSDSSGAWRGYLVVKGRVRKQTPDCKIPTRLAFFLFPGAPLSRESGPAMGLPQAVVRQIPTHPLRTAQSIDQLPAG